MRAFRIGSPCVRPAVLNAAWDATGYGLGYVMQDPDAAAYVAAVKAAGVDDAHLASLGMSPWAICEPAIDSFFLTEKAGGRWAGWRRLFVPMWGISAANAIGLKTLTSGTFVNSPSQLRGRIKGDGSTSFFNFGTTMPNDGLTSGNGFLFVYAYESDSSAESKSMVGVVDGVNAQFIRQDNERLLSARYTGSAQYSVGASQRTGIFTMSATSNTSRSFRRRSSDGVVSIATGTGESAFTLTDLNFYACGRNIANAVNQPTDAELGAYGYGLGLDDTATDAFTLNLKALWETCTGLALP